MIAPNREIHGQARLRLAFVLCVFPGLALATTQADAVSVSSSAPAVNGFDIANLGTRTGTDKFWAESGTAAGAAHGQTFKPSARRLGCEPSLIVRRRATRRTRRRLTWCASVNSQARRNDYERLWGANSTNAVSLNPFNSLAVLAIGTFAYNRRVPGLTGYSHDLWTSTNLTA